MTAPTTHVGRDVAGHATEDDCPCEQQPCGLVGAVHPDCEHHAAHRPPRQQHPAAYCPALTDRSYPVGNSLGGHW